MIGNTLRSGRVFRLFHKLVRIPKKTFTSITSGLDYNQAKSEPSDEAHKKFLIFNIGWSKIESDPISADQIVDKLQTLLMLEQFDDNSLINRHETKVINFMNALSTRAVTLQHICRLAYAVKKFNLSIAFEGRLHWLLRQFKKLCTTQHFKRVFSELETGVEQNKFSKTELTKFLPLLSHLKSETTIKILESLKPILSKLHPQTAGLATAELLESDLRDEDVPTEQFLKSLAQPYIYNNLKILHKLVLLINKYGRTTSLYNNYLLQRFFLEPVRSDTYTQYDVEILCEIIKIISQIDLNRRRMYQHLDNRMKMYTFSFYIHKNINDLRVALNMQKHLGHIMHISDCVLRKINELIQKKTIEEGSEEQKTLVEVCQQIVKDSNSVCYGFLFDKDLVPQVLEYLVPNTAQTNLFLSYAIKNYFHIFCPLLLFRINHEKSKNDDKKGFDFKISIAGLLNKPAAIVDATKNCYAKLDWKAINMADLADIMKYLANNWQVLEGSLDLKSGQIWQTFARLIKQTPQDERIMQFLYYSTIVFGRSHMNEKGLPATYFKKHIEKMIDGMNNQFTNQVSSIVRKNYALEYLVPLIAALDIPEQKVYTIMEKVDLELARSIGNWDADILHLNLQAFLKIKFNPSDTLMSRIIEFMSIFTIYIENKKNYVVNLSYVNESFVPVLKWIIAHEWTTKPKLFKTGGLQIAIDSLYDHLTIQDMLRILNLFGSDRRNYLHELMKNIRHTKDIKHKHKQLERSLNFFDDEWKDEGHESKPPSENASAEQYEYYLLRCLHHKDSSYVLRKEPRSRQETMLGICLQLSTEFMNEMKNINFQSQRKFPQEFSFEEFESRFEKIFNIRISNLKPQRAIKMEIPSENFHMTKVQYTVSGQVSRNEEKISKYNQIQLPMYSAAEQTLRSLLFGNPDPFEIGRNMYPPTIASQIITELINNNVKYTINGPILKVSNSSSSQKSDQQIETIIITSPQSYRIRVIWAYILNEQGYSVTFIPNTSSKEQIIQKIKKLFT